MKYYKLLTETSQFYAGSIFTKVAKDLFISKLHWQEQRDICFEEVTETEVRANIIYLVNVEDVLTPNQTSH